MYLFSNPLFRLVLIGFLLIGHAYALPTDRQQPLHIDADYARMDDAKGISIYTGDVKITQGTLLLTGEKVIIHHKGGDIESIFTEGDLAHYEQQPETEKEKVYADGEIIEYYVSKEQLVLKKQGSFKQEGNLIKGDYIEYNIATDKVIAKTDPNLPAIEHTKTNKERVTITIQPKNQDEKK